MVVSPFSRRSLTSRFKASLAAQPMRSALFAFRLILASHGTGLARPSVLSSCQDYFAMTRLYFGLLLKTYLILTAKHAQALVSIN
jgi:hypothetical protein